ncbi:MAG: small basic protein [Planctomycetota bacterium]
MSVDHTLKTSDALSRHHNVLSRYKRIVELERQGLWKAGENSPFGLPKVRVQQAKKKGGKQKKAEA